MTGSKRYRLGLDIGGTFTDFALQDTETGTLRVHKHLSTPSDPSIGAVEGALELLEMAGTSLAEVEQIIHGTTIGANIIVERKGGRTALLVTDGFGDILVIQRQLRHSPYDLMFDKHEPLVPRDLVFEAPERIRYDGSVERPLDEASLHGIAEQLERLEVESLAISFLHSYADGSHETRAAEILRGLLPDLSISLSHEVAPVIREYERTSTTVANAYIRPAFESYLARMRSQLDEGGFTGSLYLMQANGGVTSAEVTAQLPVRALESGPAAGVTMAAAYGEAVGLEDVLAFDMGGTTAKACVVEGGEPRMLNLFEVDQTLMRPGTGLPMMIPSVDLIEIGAGGGSLAKARLGIVQVGPESAGAEPGPVSYGLGGTDAAVTDANVVLGYLNPEFFNGGQMGLDVEGAAEAIRRDVGEELGLEVAEAAWGIHEAVTTNMEHAMRAVTIERGHDPRELTLVGFGGSGPVHAARLARNLGMPALLLPAFAGVTSAVGLLQADPRFDLVQTWISAIDDRSLSELGARFDELEAEAQALLDATGLDGERILGRSVDMRYRGQGHVVEVELDADSEVLRSRFEERYSALYGYSDEEAEPELTAVRLSARASAPTLTLPRSEPGGSEVEPQGRRQVYFPEVGGYCDCPTYRRDQIPVGGRIVGPAVVEERESTSVLLPGDIGVVDEYRNLMVHIDASEE
jgi:N-methylhydantoinase A